MVALAQEYDGVFGEFDLRVVFACYFGYEDVVVAVVEIEGASEAFVA